MTSKEEFDWVRLARSPRVGAATFRRLIARYGAAAAALEALPELSARGGRKGYAPASVATVETEIAAAAAAGATLLRLGVGEYPELLNQIHDPPPLLWALGDPAACAAPQPARPVGIVGSRTGTANGARFAEWLGTELAAAGYAVISGLARGIDAAAHRGALSGATRGAEGSAGAAVVAGGVDHVYPLENAELRERLIEKGVVLSEMPMGLHPQARHFPRRNRIISGIASGVVVVEAAERSGSLITATMALEQNREVMAAPGHPLDPRAAGGNSLIRQGATLIRGPEDVIETLAAAYRASMPPPPQGALFDAAVEAGDATLADRLSEALAFEPTPFDALVRALDAPAGQVSAAILELELAGRAETHPGGGVSLAAPTPTRSEG